jgi:hypothetical protein
LQQSRQEAESLVNTNQSLRLEGMQEHARSLSALSHHIAHNENYGKVFVQGSEYSMQDSARYFENLADEFSKQYGLTKSSTRDFFHKFAANASVRLKISIPNVDIGAGFRIEAGYSFHKSTSYNQAMNELEKIASGEEFQKHVQNMDRFSQGKNFNIVDDEGHRLANEYSSSKERLSTAQSRAIWMP